MKLAIVGSRSLEITDLENYLPDENITEIVSGGAKGIDLCAKAFAAEHGIKYTEFIPDYKSYGKAAPIIRNKTIVEYADAVIAFWDEESKGTKSVIDYSEKNGKPITIINRHPRK